jgi:hypothetical protein
MPIPVTKGAAPNARMKAVAGATAVQTTAAASAPNLILRPNQLANPVGPNFAGQAFNNPALFMVSTNLSVKFPASAGLGSPPAPGTVTFSKGGRTGPPTLTWCPGWPPTNPPTCASTGTLTPGGSTGRLPGQMVYKATKNQFGGPGQASIAAAGAPLTAGATVWGVYKSPAPCKHTAFVGPNPGCIAVKGYASPAPLVAAGGAFGYKNSTIPKQAVPNVYIAAAVPTGTIYLKVPVNTAPFINAATSYGGPWSTGQLQIKQTAAKGAPETFTITGSDARGASGLGNISLVSGAIANRAISGPNANRGWMNLSLGPKLPALPSWGIGAVALLLAGGGVARLSLARRKK